MRINTNVAAMNTYSNLTAANASKSGSLAKLSSGLRINKAGDDAAGLAISEKMKNQISGMTQAKRNAQDGISLIQTAEGALGETHSILNRMRDLTVQAANGTNTYEDREKIQDEMDSLYDEIDRIADTTKFNGISLLKGDYATDDDALSFQIGANATEQIDLKIGDMSASTLLGTKEEISVKGTEGTDAVVDDPTTTDEDETAAAVPGELPDTDTLLTTIDDAIKDVSKERSNLGATQNRLDHTINNLTTAGENLSSANSRIADVDMAEEMMSFTKSNILSQASTAMLAQANQMPQSVLQLLQ